MSYVLPHLGPVSCRKQGSLNLFTLGLKQVSVLGDHIYEMKRVAEAGQCSGDQNWEIIFCRTSTLGEPSTDWEFKKDPWSVLFPTFRSLLQSAGATEGLFVLRDRSPSYTPFP